jgi:hypothetical protein
MTMRVTVTNQDSARTAIVQVHNKGQPPETPDTLGETKELPPGEAHDFWIHQERYLLVKEKP